MSYFGLVNGRLFLRSLKFKMGSFDMLKLSLLLRNNIILGGGRTRDRLRTITRLNGISKVGIGGNALDIIV
jgi:hypothetical protein